MKKSLIWITAGIATVGFAVPAFAARGDSPEHIAPAPVTVATTGVDAGDQQHGHLGDGCHGGVER